MAVTHFRDVDDWWDGISNLTEIASNLHCEGPMVRAIYRLLKACGGVKTHKSVSMAFVCFLPLWSGQRFPLHHNIAGLIIGYGQCEPCNSIQRFLLDFAPATANSSSDRLLQSSDKRQIEIVLVVNYPTVYRFRQEGLCILCRVLTVNLLRSLYVRISLCSNFVCCECFQKIIYYLTVLCKFTLLIYFVCGEQICACNQGGSCRFLQKMEW